MLRQRARAMLRWRERGDVCALLMAPQMLLLRRYATLMMIVAAACHVYYT